jgi:hypothetical protein
VSFLFQSLLVIGLPLVALPLVIHLINLRRHRRIEWAAMQFLLESQKRHKKWILLQQILLLLLRTSAVALVVLMLAGPVLRSEWGRFFGQGTTHHLFLLDDSYSMSDRGELSSAFEEAKRAIGTILEQAARQSDNQKLTLLRFSTADGLSAGATPEIGEQPLDRALLEKVQSLLGEMRDSESDAGPLPVLLAALGLPEPSADEARVVYLVSDFRRRQWTEDEQLRQMLGQLREKCAQLHLVQCVDLQRPNLAVTRLEPEAGIRAAGVETWFELSVANYGDEPASQVAVNVVQDGHKLPAVVFDEIPPRDEATRRFRVTFPTAGAHQLQTSLERDAVEVDNVRYFACQTPATFPVLIIDESPGRDDGFYLRTALDPGGTTTPGWSPQVEPASFLRKHERLDQYAAICLLDVPRLDEPEVAALESYVRQGGGLAIFLGSEVQRPFYNERLYRDGEGLLPAPLDVPTQLVVDLERAEPDVIVGDHAIFRVFGGQRNNFLPLIGVNFYYAVDPAWNVPARDDTHVLARLRNGAPYVIDKQWGDGHVVVQLSKLSPKSTDLGSWSNWSINPVFPVYANELVGYLSATRRQFTQRKVGQQIVLDLPESDYQGEVRVKSPRAAAGESETIYPKPEKGRYQVDVGRADASGVWQFELQPREGGSERRLVAVNVAPGEGDLHFVDREQLAQRLPGLDYQYALASQMSVGGDQLAGFQLSDTLLYLLAAALVCEQWLACRASYHSRPAKSA